MPSDSGPPACWMKKKAPGSPNLGADWRHPDGIHGPAAENSHPVTQVSWNDADTFCRSYDARLPTELEWEHAARLGQTPDGHVFRAGDPVRRGGHFDANVWQGVFPLLDTGEDGYRGTSPVGAFGARAFRPHRYGRKCLGVDRVLVCPLRDAEPRAGGWGRRTCEARRLLHVRSHFLRRLPRHRARPLDAGYFAGECRIPMRSRPSASFAAGGTEVLDATTKLRRLN